MDEPRPTTCIDCGEPLAGTPHCGACGLPVQRRRITLRVLLSDLVGELFSVDSALWGSLRRLLARPGELTVDHLAGRRKGRLAPLRLYFFALLLFLSALALKGLVEGDEGPPGDRERAAAALKDLLGREPFAAAFAPQAADSLSAALERRLVPLDFPRRAADTLAVLLAGSPSAVLDPSLADSLRRELERDLRKRGSFLVAGDGSFDGSSGAPDSLDDPFSRWMGNRAQRLDRMGPAGERLFVATLVKRLPSVLFLLMPLFAFGTWLLFRRRRLTYPEHLVFAVHVHATLFLLFLPLVLVSHWTVWLGLWLLSLWLLVAGLRRVHGQGWLPTAAKAGLLVVAYGMALLPVALLWILLTVATV